RYWAIGVGPEAGRHRAALDSAVRMAATRYRLGDACTASDFAATAALRRHRGGAQVVAAIEQTLAGAAGVAAFDLDTPRPTTIGLGDTFVGGFLAAYAPATSRSS
ncbi:MAG: hypothetical protein WBX17_11730, partial [Microbacterium sp.]